jgi:hypothetical protein
MSDNYISPFGAVLPNNQPNPIELYSRLQQQQLEQQRYQQQLQMQKDHYLNSLYGDLADKISKHAYSGTPLDDIFTHNSDVLLGQVAQDLKNDDFIGAQMRAAKGAAELNEYSNKAKAIDAGITEGAKQFQKSPSIDWIKLRRLAQAKAFHKPDANGALSVIDPRELDEKNDYVGDVLNTMPELVTNGFGSLYGQIEHGRYLMLHNFLADKVVQKWASSNDKAQQMYNQAFQKLFTAYPSYGKKLIGETIANEREQRGDNNSVINLLDDSSDPKKQTYNDKLFNELVQQGKLPKEAIPLYQQMRGKLDYYVPTPDVTSSMLDGTHRGMDNALHFFSDWFTDGKQATKDALERQYATPQLKTKGVLHDITHNAGEFTGEMIPLMLLTKGLNAAGLAPKVASAVSVGVMFEHPNRERAAELYPNDTGAQNLYTLGSTALDVAIGSLYDRSKPLEALSQETKSSIGKIIEDFRSGAISEAAYQDAMKGTFEDFLSKAEDLGKSFFKHNTQQAAQMAGFTAAHDLMDATLGKKDFTPENTAESFKNAFLYGGLLSAMAAHAESKPAQATSSKLYEMAKKPEPFQDAIERDETLSDKDRFERLSNLDKASSILQDLRSTALGKDQQQRYLLHALNEHVLTDKMDDTTDSVLKEKYQQEINQSKKIRQAILKEPLKVRLPQTDVSEVSATENKAEPSAQTDTETLPEEPNRENNVIRKEAKPVTVSEQVKDVEPEDTITLSEVIDKPITYQGEPATLYQDGQTLVAKITGKDREYELGNVNEIKDRSIKDFGIEHENSIVTSNAEGDIVVRDKVYKNNYSNPLAAINYDKDGNVHSVTLDTPEGQKRNFKGNVAEDIAYEITLKHITKDHEQFENFINNEPAATTALHDARVQVTTEEKAASDHEPVFEKQTTPEGEPGSQQPSPQRSAAVSVETSAPVQGDATLGEKEPVSTANKLRLWADKVDQFDLADILPEFMKAKGMEGVQKNDLLALPKAVVSTLLRGTATAIEAGKTVKDALLELVEKVKEYYRENGLQGYDEAKTVRDVKAVFEHMGILEPDAEQAANTLLRNSTREQVRGLINSKTKAIGKTVDGDGFVQKIKEPLSHFGEYVNQHIIRSRFIKGFLDWWHPFVFDTTGEGRKAYMAIREMESRINQAMERLDQTFKKQAVEWMKVPKEDRVSFILSCENPAKFGTVDPKFKAYAEQYRKMFDDAFAMISAVKDVPYIEDYFTHFWKDTAKAKEIFAGLKRKTLEGNKSFLKERFYADYLEGIKAGLEPVTTNPAEIVILNMNNALRFSMAHKLFAEMRDNHLIKEFEAGKVPEGFTKLDDRLFSKNFTTNYYAPEQVALIINRYAEKGLFDRNDPIGAVAKTVRRWNNFKNLVQLGFSPFHIVTTLIETNVNGVKEGLQDLTTFRPRLMLKGLLQIPYTLSQLRTVNMIRKGLEIRKDYRSGNWTTDVDNLVKAGGRTGLSKMYALDSKYNIQKAWYSLATDKDISARNIGNLILHSASFVPELLGSPIFTHWVAPLKIAGHAESLAKELQRRPDMDAQELQKTSQRLWDAMDDSLGQVVYDNVWWKKSVKDLGFMAIRSLGWTGGTVKKIGKGVGGVADSFVKTKATPDGNEFEAGRLLKGQGLNPNTAWMISLFLTTGFLGGMMHRILSGQNPQELEDYYYPWDGTCNPDGTKHRLVLPTYMKDIIGYSTHTTQTVGHKLSPAIQEAVELMQNKDFYGVQVYNPDDDAFHKGMDMLKYELNTITPFAFRQKPGSDESFVQHIQTKEGMRQFFGITDAPKDVQRSATESLILELSRKKFGDDAKTKEEFEKIMARKRVKDMLRDGQQYKDIPQALKDSAGIDHSRLHSFIKEAKEQPFENEFKHLSVIDQVKVWKQMTEEEKEQYAPFIHKPEALEKVQKVQKVQYFSDEENEKAFQEMKARLPKRKQQSYF